MFVVFCGFVVFIVLFCVIWFFSSSFFNKLFFGNSVWVSSYECGFASNSLSFNVFSFTYFSLLVFFVIFDLEISLLLNMPEQGFLFVNFIYYYTFLVLLSFSFIVEILVGYVRWGY